MQSLVGLLVCGSLLAAPGFAAAHTPHQGVYATAKVGHKHRQHRREKRESRHHGHERGRASGEDARPRSRCVTAASAPSERRGSHAPRPHYYYPYAPHAYHNYGHRRRHRHSHYW